MANPPSTAHFPILGLRDATPRYRRRRPRSWRVAAYELATDTARRLPWALTGAAAVAVLALLVLGITIPRAGDLVVIAVAVFVLAAAGFSVWKVTVR